MEDVWKRVYDPDPRYGAPMLKDGAVHMILLHAHDETEEMVPGYCRLLIDQLLELGVQFEKPDFFLSVLIPTICENQFNNLFS